MESPSASMKDALVKQICSELKSRLDKLCRAAREAHAAATDPGSKAEGKYDTRSLEASYLASGQARQVENMREALRVFENLRLPQFESYQAVDVGALVEVEMPGGRANFLLAPVGGGMEIGEGSGEVILLTPESALYQKLLGLYVGDELEQPTMRVVGIG